MLYHWKTFEKFPIEICSLWTHEMVPKKWPYFPEKIVLIKRIYISKVFIKLSIIR